MKIKHKLNIIVFKSFCLSYPRRYKFALSKYLKVLKWLPTFLSGYSLQSKAHSEKCKSIHISDQNGFPCDIEKKSNILNTPTGASMTWPQHIRCVGIAQIMHTLLRESALLKQSCLLGVLILALPLACEVLPR